MPAVRSSPRLVLTVLAVATASFAMPHSLLSPAGADGLPAERGLTTAFLVLAGASLAAAALALLVPTTRRPAPAALEAELPPVAVPAAA